MFEELICIKGGKCKLLTIKETIYTKKPYFDAQFSVMAQKTILWCSKPNKDDIPKPITTLIKECKHKITHNINERW